MDPVLTKVGTIFASTGLSANFFTWLSLITFTFAGILYASRSFIGEYWVYLPAAGSSLILLGGFLDIADGSVARITKGVSKRGSFLDSTGDRISEAVIFIGIAEGGFVEPTLCMIALSLSFLVSYSRAKAESLNLSLAGVGVGERAERLFLLAVISLIPVPKAMEWAVIAVCIVACSTLIHRIAVATNKLA
jgi:archaetidylinositol phosphate synthase